MPFFHPDGKNVFTRHELNHRQQLSTRREYKELILKMGLMKDMRAGRPMAVPDPLDPETWQLNLIAAATLVEALYDAAEEDPSNAQVRASLQDGLTSAIVLHPKTPWDVVEYLRDSANRFVAYGSRTSFLERYKMISKIEAAWRAERLGIRKAEGAEGDAEDPEQPELDVPAPACEVLPGHAVAEPAAGKRSQKGFETAYAKLLNDKFPERFRSFTQLDLAKRGLHKMHLCGQWGAYSSYCDAQVIFTSAELKDAVIFQCNDTIMRMFGASEHVCASVSM